MKYQESDLVSAKNKILELIEKTDTEAKRVFLDVFNKINNAFGEYIKTLFIGGEGFMKIDTSVDLLESGIEISVKRVGHRHQKLQLLSGGEKALVGIALIMAFLAVNPSPFYVLDEIDAPLDEYNAERFKNLLFDAKAQFIVITHNRLVMEAAEILHGVTMVNGISMIIPVEVENVINQ